MRIKKNLFGVGVLAAAAAMLLTPATAQAVPVGVAEREVIQIPMEWDCSTFTEADRQKAVAENIDICGALGDQESGISARVTNPGNCGTASMYVDKRNSNTRRVS